MTKLISRFIQIFVIIQFNTYSQDTLNIKGTNFGKPLILENPIYYAAKDLIKNKTSKNDFPITERYCIQQIIINGKRILINKNKSCIEINFSKLSIPINSQLIIKIICKNKLIPRILNPESIKAKTKRSIKFIYENSLDSLSNKLYYDINSSGKCLIKWKILNADSIRIKNNIGICVKDYFENSYACTDILTGEENSDMLILEYRHYYHLTAYDNNNNKFQEIIIDLTQISEKLKSQCAIVTFYFSNEFNSIASYSDNYIFPWVPVKRLRFDLKYGKLKWDNEYSKIINKSQNLINDINILEKKLKILRWRKFPLLMKKDKLGISDATRGAMKEITKVTGISSTLEKQKIENSQKAKSNEMAENKIKAYLFIFMAIFFTCILIFEAYKRQKQLKNEVLHQKKQIEEQKVILEDKNLELQELNQLKDRLFTIISHDIKSPLMSLHGFLLLLKEKINENFNQDSQLKSLELLMNNTIATFDNLLYWSVMQTKGIKLNFSSINMFKLIEDQINLVECILISKQIEIINEVEMSKIAFADESSVKLIIKNIISNAVKYTHNGGVIKISCHENKEEMKIVIEDSGIGIKNENLLKIFSSIQQTRKGTCNEEGIGLGLLLTKELIKMNNGKIAICSQEKKWTKVSFTLENYVGTMVN
jgi:signal transduction histidine kinase